MTNDKKSESGEPATSGVASVASSQPQNDVSLPAGGKSIPWPSIQTLAELYKADETRRSGGQVYTAQGKKMGEILNSLGVIDDKTLKAVEEHHRTKKIKNKPIGQLLVHMGIIEAEVLIRALCIQSGMLMVDVLSIDTPYDILKLIPKEKAREKEAIPVGVYKGTLFLAVADPFNFADQPYFSFTTGLNVKPVFAPRSEIIERIDKKWIETDSDIWAG